MKITNFANRAKTLLNPGIRKKIYDITDDEQDREQIFILSQYIINAVCDTLPYQEDEDWTDLAIEWGARLGATILIVIIIVAIVSVFV